MQELGIFSSDKYAKVKKVGWQIYKKDCILIDKKLWESRKDSLEPYFTTEKLDYNLVLYLGDYGITASYTELYCSQNRLNEIKELLK